MQLCRIIYYFIVPWLLYMFRAIVSLIIRSILIVITATATVGPTQLRQQPTAAHVNETRSCNYS
jgi:hypothetical protein